MSICLSALAVHRLRLPYNGEGRHLDPTSAVVYQQQAAEVVGVAAIVAWLVTAFLARYLVVLARTR